MNDPTPYGAADAVLPMPPQIIQPQIIHMNREVADFAEAVDRVFVRDEIETFWRCEDAFRRLLDSGFAAEMFRHELRAIVDDATYIGDWQRSQLMVQRGSGFALSLALFETPRRYIHTTPYYGMYAPLGAQGLHYDRYRLPANYRNDVFDPSLRLEPAGSGVTRPGAILQLLSAEYAYDFRVEQPTLVAKFTSAPFHTLEWLFSKDSLRPWQANDSELSSTQLRVAAYILGKLAHQSSLEPLLAMTRHPHHAVRWAAIQAVGRLSRTEALTQLQRAQADPHPHLRRAAAKTLKQLEGKN